MIALRRVYSYDSLREVMSRCAALAASGDHIITFTAGEIITARSAS